MHVVLNYVNVGDKNKQCSCQVGLNKNLIVLFMYYHITVKDDLQASKTSLRFSP